DGTLVVKDGTVVNRTKGRTLTVRPEADKAMARRLDRYFDERFGLPSRWFEVPDFAIGQEDPFKVMPYRT
ncbi:MAG: formylmethanofuran dehydrogenase subunit A, partial [Aurantimonas sp.]|nr:formylmethanofuran dehydrogenase subunit A [Aurantimonas sp.]